MNELGRSRRRWRTAFWILLAGWLASVGWLLYSAIDQGVTIAYMQDGLRDREHDLTVLRKLLPALAPGATRSVVLDELRRQNRDALISATDSAVTTGGLVFRFDTSGVLRSVDLLGD